MDNKKILFKSEVYDIQGAVFEVYREMGAGFLEAVYQECLGKEFCMRNIQFIAQPILNIYYKGKGLEQYYKPDFVCYDKIILEIKALKETDKKHEAQLFNYLKASGFRLGLLINFGHQPKATVKRVIL